MRFSTTVLVVALVLSGLSGSVSAWQLNLTGQHHVWNPVDPSPTHFVGIENPGGSIDPLFAWSLGLQITPDPSALGSVSFAGASVPINYLLAGRSGGVTPAFAGPASSIEPIGDTDSMFTGIVVPGAGKNLLATTFVASPDAEGLFRIFAVPDQFTGANWFSSDFLNARDFENVPFDGEPVEIGSIMIVPEPSTVLLASQIAVGLVLFTRRRRRGQRQTDMAGRRQQLCAR